MKRHELIERIIRAAERDEKRRCDPRYLETMGFLLAKGFLKTNQAIALRPNKRIIIADAVWAGMNVEPRILEVLPAAIVRLPRHFDLDPVRHRELYAVVKKLTRQEEHGEALWGVPYEKLKVWAHLPLTDGRTKPFTEKKITRTFRLKRAVIDKLRRLAKEWGCSDTEALERTIAKS